MYASSGRRGEDFRGERAVLLLSPINYAVNGGRRTVGGGRWAADGTVNGGRRVRDEGAGVGGAGTPDEWLIAMPGVPASDLAVGWSRPRPV